MQVVVGSSPTWRSMLRLDNWLVRPTVDRGSSERGGSSPSLSTSCRGGVTGRRAGFKFPCPVGREGSSPSLGTTPSQLNGTSSRFLPERLQVRILPGALKQPVGSLDGRRADSRGRYAARVACEPGTASPQR